jgi:hypothetical protein
MQFFWELHAASIMIFMPTNVTPQEKKGDIFVLTFFIGIRGVAPTDIQEW